MEQRARKSIDELLRADRYTPRELAELLQIGEHIVYNAAYEGELPAQFIGHDVVSIRRDDALAWFNECFGHEPVDALDARTP